MLDHGSELVVFMVALKKPDLDEATLQIARRMLSMPPKPHSESKIGKPSGKRRTSPKKAKLVKKPGR